MAQLLEKAQLPERNRMAEMDIDPGRVDAQLDAKRSGGLEAALELLPQLGLRNNVIDASPDQG